MDNASRRELFWRATMVLIIACIGVIAALMLYNRDSESRGFPGAAVSAEAPGNVENLIRPRFGVSEGEGRNMAAQSPGVPRQSGGMSQPGAGPQHGAGMNSVGQSRVSTMIDAMRGGMAADMLEEIERMRQVMDGMMSGAGAFPGNSFDAGFGGMQGAIHSFSDEGGNYIIRMGIPHIDNSTIKARVEKDMLIVSGIQRQETEESAGLTRTFSSSSSSFTRSFRLPGPVDAAGLRTEYNDEGLTVILPKR